MDRRAVRFELGNLSSGLPGGQTLPWMHVDKPLLYYTSFNISWVHIF
jgi:hypothetical protein